jgi:hypothetical protein
LARPNASPDPFQSNAQLLPTSSTGKGTSETVAAPTGTANATGSGTPASFSYSGLWDDTEVTLRVITARSAPAVAGVAGQLTAFVTDDPNAACLTNESGLTVHAVKGDPSEFLVRAISPTDCTTAEFVFTTR